MKNAFTLIELLVVIAIIAILALLSTLFLKGGTTAAPEDSLLQKVNTSSAAPAAPAPAPNPATTADTTKK